MKGQTKKHANAALTELERRQGGRGHRIDRPPVPVDEGVGERHPDPGQVARRRARNRAGRRTRQAQRRSAR